MESLAAVGIACNVMQCIDFGVKTASICKKLYNNQAVDENLDYISTNLWELSKDLDASLKAIETQGTFPKDQRELRKVAQKCLESSVDLKKELDKLSIGTVHGGRRFAATIGKSAETLWRKRKLNDLEKAMVDCQRAMETRILVHILSQSDALRISQDVAFKDLSSQLKQFVQQYNTGSADLLAHISKEAIDIQNNSAKEHQETREHLTNALQSVDLDDSRKQCKQLLASVRFTIMNKRRNDIVEAHEKTFEWIFNDSIKRPWDNFQEWLTSDGKLYWINGKPGSGKSTLMKFIVDDPRTQSGLEKWFPSVTILSAFFWVAGPPMQNTIKGVLCSLLYQLLRDQEAVLPELIKKSSKLRACLDKDAPDDWSVRELESAFAEVNKYSSSRVCIFLDGLDEVSPSEGPFELLDFLSRLQALPGLKICASSRPEPQFERSLDKNPKLRLQDLTASDIRLYVDRIFEDASKDTPHEKSEDFKTKFGNLMVWKADGVFLWVHLAMKSLRKGLLNYDSDAILLERLEALPSGLSSLYSHMWTRLNGDEVHYRKEAALFLKIVLQKEELCIQKHSRIASLLTFALGTNISAIEEFMRSTEAPPDRALVELCTNAQRNVKVRCAGLIEWLGLPLGHGEPLSFHYRSKPDHAECLQCHRPDNISLLRYDDICTLDYDNHHLIEFCQKNLAATFIHRTARDFLLFTEEGKAILAWDATSTEDLSFAFTMAGLVILVWRGDSWDISHYTNHFERVSFLNQQKLLVVYTKLYGNGHLLKQGAEFSDPEHGFLAFAASFGHTKIVQERLCHLMKRHDFNPEYTTYLLHCAVSIPKNSSTSEKTWSTMRKHDLAELLLKLGANPNTRRKQSYNNTLDTSFLAFIHLIQSAWSPDQPTLFLRSLATIEAFVKAGADLESKTYRIYEYDEGLKYRYVDSGHSQMLRGEIPAGRSRVILEANAAFQLTYAIRQSGGWSSEIEVRLQRLLSKHTPCLTRLLALNEGRHDAESFEPTTSFDELFSNPNVPPGNSWKEISALDSSYLPGILARLGNDWVTSDDNANSVLDAEEERNIFGDAGKIANLKLKKQLSAIYNRSQKEVDAWDLLVEEGFITLEENDTKGPPEMFINEVKTMVK